MILIDNKSVSRKEAEAEISKLTRALDSAKIDIIDAENALSVAEDKAFTIKRKIDSILDQINGAELSIMLPYDLKTRGYQLRETTERTGSRVVKRITYLEDRYGNVVCQWSGAPSLTDLFEASKELLESK